MWSNRIKPLLDDFNLQSSTLHQKTGRSRFLWRIKMFNSLVCIGAKPVDYVRFEFWRKSKSERNRYMTSLRYSKLYRYLRNTVPATILKSKSGEYSYYKDFVKRNWMVIDGNTKEEDIVAFVNRYHTAIVKPDNDEQGSGIFKLKDSQPKKISDFSQSKCNKVYVMEEVLENDKDFAVMNESSLNSVRATTMIDKNGNPILLSLMLRVGKPGQIVDNWGAGGFLIDIDVESGCVIKPALDKKNRPYISHPDTGFQFVGWHLPKLDELKEYVNKLCMVEKTARFVGWDIAYTPNGFDLVEVNIPAGHEGVQAFNTPIYDIIQSNW